MFRRRKERKTDYARRMKFLKSETPRLVFRKTNRYLITQYVTSKEAQDKIEMGISTKELLKHGWPKELSGSLKSITAAYFLGILVGKKIKEKKLREPIVDFGMMRMIHKSKPHAFLKGLVDSGLKLKHDEKTFPKLEKIQGKHIKNFDFEKIKSKVLEK